MANGDIPDANIEASNHAGQHYAKNGRLNYADTWALRGSTSDAWIQADIGYQTYISGLITQGDGGVGPPCWVTSVRVSTFSVTTSDPEVFIQEENGDVKVF